MLILRQNCTIFFVVKAKCAILFNDKKRQKLIKNCNYCGIHMKATKWRQLWCKAWHNLLTFRKHKKWPEKCQKSKFKTLVKVFLISASHLSERIWFFHTEHGSDFQGKRWQKPSFTSSGLHCCFHFGGSDHCLPKNNHELECVAHCSHKKWSKDETNRISCCESVSEIFQQVCTFCDCLCQTKTVQNSLFCLLQKTLHLKLVHFPLLSVTSQIKSKQFETVDVVCLWQNCAVSMCVQQSKTNLRQTADKLEPLLAALFHIPGNCLTISKVNLSLSSQTPLLWCENKCAYSSFDSFQSVGKYSVAQKHERQHHCHLDILRFQRIRWSE